MGDMSELKVCPLCHHQIKISDESRCERKRIQLAELHDVKEEYEVARKIKEKAELLKREANNKKMFVEPRKFTEWQAPLCEWLKPLAEWQAPLSEWQSPLSEWYTPSGTQRERGDIKQEDVIQF